MYYEHRNEFTFFECYQGPDTTDTVMAGIGAVLAWHAVRAWDALHVWHMRHVWGACKWRKVYEELEGLVGVWSAELRTDEGIVAGTLEVVVYRNAFPSHRPPTGKIIDA